MTYLNVPTKQIIYSNFSTFTEDAQTRTELMNKPLKKLYRFVLIYTEIIILNIQKKQ